MDDRPPTTNVSIHYASPVLAGKDADGRPLAGHEHAYYLPADENGTGSINRVTVYAAGGFGAEEIAALAALRELHLASACLWSSPRDASCVHGPPLDYGPAARDRGASIGVRLIGLGQPGDFRAPPDGGLPAPDGHPSGVPLLGPACVWVSATPFLASRYPKRSGTRRDPPEAYATPQTFAEHVLRQELDRLRERLRRHGLDLPAIVCIDTLDACGVPARLRPNQYHRDRQKPGDDGGRRPCGAFRLTFAAPLHGPLSLGHSCHFGLGLFVAASDCRSRAAK
jgi:CRISPR-associated protein Csb2